MFVLRYETLENLNKYSFIAVSFLGATVCVKTNKHVIRIK